MLSILIPVYNWDVVGLVTALHGQCLRSGVDFEIRCYEDGSTVACRDRNGELQSYDRVVYRVYKKNAGRAAIRNRLLNRPHRAAAFGQQRLSRCGNVCAHV